MVTPPTRMPRRLNAGGYITIPNALRYYCSTVVEEAKDGSKGSLEWAKKKAKTEPHPAYNLIKEVLEKNQKQCVRESTSVPCRVEESHVATNVIGPSVVRQSTSVLCRSQELHVPVNVSLERRQAGTQLVDGGFYPEFDPKLPWNEMKPTLGLKFEHPEQLKDCLTNYGVANGYQLWYRRNDYRSLFVLCGRDLAEGRSSGKKGKKGKDEDELPKKDKGLLLRSPKKGKKGCYIRSPSKKGVRGQSSADKGTKKGTKKVASVKEAKDGSKGSLKWAKKKAKVPRLQKAGVSVPPKTRCLRESTSASPHDQQFSMLRIPHGIILGNRKNSLTDVAINVVGPSPRLQNASVSVPSKRRCVHQSTLASSHDQRFLTPGIPHGI
ncbi:hypothetical protein Tco_0693738, partial [Tanacetum coccineum]